MSELKLYVDDKPLALAPNTRIRIRLMNSMFGDGRIQGTFSFPFQLPKKPNMLALGFAHDPLVVGARKEYTEGVRLEYAGEHIQGKLLVNDAGSFFECQFLTDDGQAANDLQGKRLADLKFATAYQNLATASGTENYSRNLSRPNTEGGWPKYPYVVFPWYNPGYFGDSKKVSGHFIANECLNETFGGVDYVRPKVTGNEGTPRRVSLINIVGTFLNGETVVATGGGSGQIATNLTDGVWHVVSGPSGTFTGELTGLVSGATADITTSQSGGAWPARYWQAPAVYVMAVFEGLAKELGYEFVTSLVNDDEFISMVLLTGKALNYELESTWNATPPYPYYITYMMPGFYLKDYLPEWTVAEFLREFKTFWGIVVSFDVQTKQTRLKLMRDILRQQPDADWSSIAEAVYTKEVRSSEQRTLTYTVDENDLAVPIKAIFTRRRVDPVTPPDGGYRVGDIFLDTDGYWYEYYQTLIGALETRLYSFDIGEVQADGQVPVELKSRCAVMPTDLANPLAVRMPRMNVKGNIDGFEVGSGNDYVPRILFYRGLWPIDNETLGFNYPYASCDEFAPDGSDVYNYSLRFSGEKGVFKNFISEYTDFMGRTEVVKRRFALQPGNIFSIDLERRKVIDGAQYYIKHIDVTLPIKTLAEAELYTF